MNEHSTQRDHTADGAIVAPSFAFGINTTCFSNLHYLEGQKLLYQAGQFLVSLSADEGKSTFIPIAANSQAVSLLQLSANKRYLAAAEWPHNAEQQQVSVYNIPEQKREQTLQWTSQVRSTTVTALSFSGDTKLLLTLTAEPDWTVLLWRWQQAKVLLALTLDCPAVSASLNPWDDNLLAVAGRHVVKVHRFDIRTGASKASNVLMLDTHKNTTVTCLVHLVGGMLAIGTSSGKILVCGAAGLLSVHDISPAASRQSTTAGAASAAAALDLGSSCAGMRGRSHSGAVQASSPGSVPASPTKARSSVLAPWQDAPQASSAEAQQTAGLYAVQALVQRGRGFVAAGSRGDVYLFEPASGTKGSSSADAFHVPQQFAFAEPDVGGGDSLASSSSSGHGHGACGSASGSGLAGQWDSNPSGDLAPELRVCGLAVSTTDEHVAVATAAGKLMLLNITAMLQAQEEEADANQARPANLSIHSSSDGTPSGALLVEAAAGAPDCAAVTLGPDCFEQSQCGWQVVCSGFPTGRVAGLDAVQHLPLLLVASEDGWVRVWDWMRCTQVASRHLHNRQPMCCSLHPSGLLAAVGTSESLAVFWVLKGGLSPVAEMPACKNTNVVRYSHTGGLLAAAGGNNIVYVYPAYYGHEGSAGRACSSRGAAHSHSTAASASSGEGSAVLEAVAVLKGHISSVTDLVFTGDDRQLISTGAGGAVYFWDLSTGSRLVELEYVDKKCVYCSAAFSDHHGAAVVRTMDGRLQHIKDGQLLYEAMGLAQDCCPMAMTADGRVVLAATSSGSIFSIGWPKEPGSAQSLQHAASDLDVNSIAGMVGPIKSAQPSPVGKLELHAAGAYRHLSVQVGAASSVSPRASSNKSGSSTPRLAAGTCSSTPRQLDSRPAPAPAGGSPQQLQARPGTGDATVQGSSTTAGPGWHEYRLHASRITAMKILHHAGVMFTASADGLVLASSLPLVLDGVLIEPPPPGLPPSATAQGNSCTMGSTLNSTLTASADQGQSELAPPIVLIDDAVLLTLQDKFRMLQQRMSAMQRESQYQVLRQAQALKESLAASDSRVAGLSAELEAVRAELEHCRQKAVADQEQILTELEQLHSSAAEQLEGLYETRLALEKERLRQLAAAKDDLELSLKEEMKRRALQAERELADVHQMYKQQLAAGAAQAEAAAAAAAEADAVWQEVLMQTEEDLEKKAETDSERLATLQQTAEETQVKLRAEINILTRGNDRLKAEKTADAARVAALMQDVKALQQQLVDAGSVADKLRNELNERDSVISDNYVTMQGLRRRVQELETHKFVLTYKNEAVTQQLQPKEEQLKSMQATVNAQDKELLAGRSALLAAQRAVAERNASVASAKQELWEAKRKMSHQSALLDAVAHDIAFVLQQPNERMPGGKTALQQALERLAIKYCTKRGGGPRTSMQVEAEMVAHIVAAEKKSNILEHKLKRALTDNQHNSRRLMADNTALLADLAELQRTNKELTHKLAAATHQLAAVQQEQAQAGASRGGVQPEAASVKYNNGGPTCTQPADGPTLQRLGRSQGVRSSGQLVPASEGRYIEAAMRQQFQHLADLQAALDATTGIVALQATHIARLQERVATEGKLQELQSGALPVEGAAQTEDDPAERSKSSSPCGVPASSPNSRRPRTAEGSSCAASPSKLLGRASAGGGRSHSPPGVIASLRPALSGHQGMMASMRSDLAAWRAK